MGCAGAPPPPEAGVERQPLAASFRPDGRELADCRRHDGPCVEQAFGNVAFRAGPRAALARLRDEAAHDARVQGDCHRIAHTIGSAALARLDGDVGAAFSRGDSTCWSGYYHGILERALAGTRSLAGLVAQARSLCEGVKRTESRFTVYQCVHGLGHGLMLHTRMDLERSLAVCDALAEEWDRTSCHGGAFMEHFAPSAGGPPRGDGGPALHPCPSVAERHKLYCYLQVTDRLLVRADYDWRATARHCSAAEAAWRGTCFQSFGRSASGASRRDAAALHELCRLPPRAYRGDCVYGAVRDIAADDAGGGRAAAFCRDAPAPLRRRCYAGLGTILADLLGRARLPSACAELAGAHADACALRQPDP